MTKFENCAKYETMFIDNYTKEGGPEGKTNIILKMEKSIFYLTKLQLQISLLQGNL